MSTQPELEPQSTQKFKLDGRSKRIKWETNKQLIPAKPVKPGQRPVKPIGVEHKYFETIAWSEEGSRRVKCNYCPHELWANTSRMRHHIVNNCRGQVPDEVKLELTIREGNLESKKLKQIKKQVITTRSKLKSTSRNSIVGSTSTGSIDVDCETVAHETGLDEVDCINDAYGEEDEERVARLLRSLIAHSAPKSSPPSSKILGQKPGSKLYSDEEYLAITRELTIQKMKLEIELMNDQKKIISKLSKGLDSITKAADLWIEKEEQSMSQSTTNLTVHYANDDGTYMADDQCTESNGTSAIVTGSQ